MAHTSKIMPVQIKTPTGASDSVRSFVFGLADLTATGYKNIENAEQLYRDRLQMWKKAIQRMRIEKSNALLRWKLGKEIVTFFNVLKEKYSITITNKVEAIALDLKISETTVSSIIKMAERFTESEVKEFGFNWSKFNELLRTNDTQKMNECIKLIKSGKIKYDSQIREFLKGQSNFVLH